MAVLMDDFKAAWGIRSGHAQTFYGVLGRPLHKLPLRRERRATPDDDFVDLDILDGEAGKPTVLVLHGLEGSSKSGYVQMLLSQLHAVGWGAIAINARSCSGELNRQAAFYSSGDYRDLSWLTKTLEGRVFAVGFSLGASVLLNFLAQDEAAARITAAVAISTPFNLALAAQFLDSESLMARLYLRRFLPPLKAKALAKAAAYPQLLNHTAIAGTTRIRDFDHLVTAPLYGFVSAEDYYQRCSTGPQLHRITTRTLLISSRDDALAPPLLPDEVTQNKALDVLLTQRGGHVGFIGGSLFAPQFWAEQKAITWLSQRGEGSASR